jgi:hypothetical protein
LPSDFELLEPLKLNELKTRKNMQGKSAIRRNLLRITGNEPLVLIPSRISAEAWNRRNCAATDEPDFHDPRLQHRWRAASYTINQMANDVVARSII